MKTVVIWDAGHLSRVSDAKALIFIAPFFVFKFLFSGFSDHLNGFNLSGFFCNYFSFFYINLKNLLSTY